MVLPVVFYNYSANEIAQGRFSEGGDLTGVFATHVPEQLRAGQELFMFGFPAAVFYVVWMVIHSFVGGPWWLAAPFAALITVPVGFVAFGEAWLSPPEDELATASAAALVACLVVVAVEITLRFTLRREPPQENESLPWGSLES